jgi:hypothetical protein
MPATRPGPRPSRRPWANFRLSPASPDLILSPSAQPGSHHYRHFNAATLIDAADGYKRHLDGGGAMLITLAGAMSTAELGLSLAEMIRRDKVHAICCTGANLEEDLFNLVAHDTTSACPTTAT